jgi:hypothetical protein
LHVKLSYTMPLVEICAISCTTVLGRQGCCTPFNDNKRGETDNRRIDRDPLYGSVPMIAERGAVDEIETDQAMKNNDCRFGL